jgi:sodium/hydrogen antiporter
MIILTAQSRMTYFLSITIIGLVALSFTWIAHLSKKIHISYSIVFVLIGALVYSLFDDLPFASPYRDEKIIVHLTELMVIIALMGTGLRIDKPFGFYNWSLALRLVSITMILSIAAIAALGYWWLGLGLPSAVLLGAVLAPTDPVLASDVQVGPPNSGEENNVRFALTAEAGFNDGMAFPFTWLAISLAIAAQTAEYWLADWFLYDVIYRLSVGTAAGFIMGKLVVGLFFILPEKLNIDDIREGLIALSATLLIYGCTEMLQGYGFLAVFVAALTIRNHEMGHSFHKQLHSFIDQTEHILMAVLLILFGGSLVNGILDPLTLKMAIAGVMCIVLVRPATSMLGLVGYALPTAEKWKISFFGIKGIGSFFYLSFALHKAEFQHSASLWALVAFIVLISIVIHGLSATRIMK